MCEKKGIHPESPSHTMVFSASTESHLQRETQQRYAKEFEIYGAKVEKDVLTVGTMQPT